MTTQDRDPHLHRFLARLTRLELPSTTNPYDRTREGRRRLGNLRHYLSHYRPPVSPLLEEGGGGRCDVLLVAEAFGYRGGRVTGVPLTSEAVIDTHPRFRHCFPDIVDAYIPCREKGAHRTESTASIVWRLFDELELDVAPCCWNIVPLHPFDVDAGLWSNRTPTRREIDTGAEFAVDLIDLLRPSLIIAVGKCASRGLSTAGIDHVAVRHPSQGGANLFREQMREILLGQEEIDERVRVPCP